MSAQVQNICPVSVVVPLPTIIKLHTLNGCNDAPITLLLINLIKNSTDV